jgi:TPR repeat protein
MFWNYFDRNEHERTKKDSEKELEKFFGKRWLKVIYVSTIILAILGILGSIVAYYTGLSDRINLASAGYLLGLYFIIVFIITCISKAIRSVIIRKIIQSIEDGFPISAAEKAMGGAEDENKSKFYYFIVEWINKLPDTGTPEVDFLKGVFFKDDTQKIFYLKSAAEKGLPIAQFFYGQLDEDLKIEWIEKAANQGYALAMWLLGNYYNNAENNKDLAFYWYNRAADQGNEMGQMALGRMYQFGEGTEVNIDKAIEFYTKASKKGNPIAQNNLGLLLLEKGLDADKDKGVYYLTQAGKINPTSIYDLGYCYEHGITVEKDIEEANRLYRQSADRNCVDAQINLGINLIVGNGVEKNVFEGITWIKKAVDAGNPDAIYVMGHINIFGFNELKKNYSEAYSYLSQIKDHPSCINYNDGIGYLATLLYFGLGVPSDREGALELFKSINVDMSSTSEHPLWLKELSLCFIINIDETSPVSSEVIQLKNSCWQLPHLIIECMKGMSFPDFYNFHKELDIDYARLRPRRDDLWRCLKEYKGNLWEVLGYSGLKNADDLMDAVVKDDYDMFCSYYEVDAAEIPAFSYIFCSWQNYLENCDEASNEQMLNYVKLQKKIIAAGKVKGKWEKQFSAFCDNMHGFVNDDFGFTDKFDMNLFNIKSILLTSYGIISLPGFFDQDQDKVETIRDIFESQLFKKLQIVETMESWNNPSTNETKVSSDRGCGEVINAVELEPLSPPHDKKAAENETKGTPVEERNQKYPFVLKNRRRLCKKTLIDEVCKKFLSKWFKNKIDDVPLIKYVFFEYGTPSTDKLIFTGDIKDLVSFLLFLNGSGTKEIWDYINKFIVKENGEPVLGNNPRSNVKENLYDAIGRVRQGIGQAIDRELNKEEEEDLK